VKGENPNETAGSKIKVRFKMKHDHSWPTPANLLVVFSFLDVLKSAVSSVGEDRLSMADVWIFSAVER